MPSSGGMNGGIEMSFKDLRITTYNRDALDAVGSGLAWQAANRAGRRAVGYARQELARADRIDTGKLRDSLKHRVLSTPLGPTVSVYSELPEALWVNSGTAQDGAGFIYPVNSRLLRFNPSRRNSHAGATGVVRGRGGRFATAYVFAPRVRGQKGTHFMETALKRVRVRDFV